MRVLPTVTIELTTYPCHIIRTEGTHVFVSQVRTFLKWLVHEVVLVELFFGAIKIVGCSKIPDGAIMSCTAKIFQVEFA